MMPLENFLQTLRLLISTHCEVPLAGWPTQLSNAQPSSPVALPVRAWLECVASNAPPQAQGLTQQLLQLAPLLKWNRTYAQQDVSKQFWEGYGWTELVGKNAPFRDDSVSMGLLLLGPYVYYPEHWHPATEHYVPLSGTADWYADQQGWHEVEPLRTIVHPSMIKHAIRTHEQPLLAFFHWSGVGIEQSATMK